MAKPSVYIDDSYIKKDGTCNLYVRYYIGTSYVRVAFGVSVEPLMYDKTTFRVKGKNSKDFNNLIQKAIGRASDIVLKYQVNEKTLTKELFKKELSNPAVLTDFYLFVKEQIALRRGEVTDSTIAQHKSVINNLKKFKSELLLTEIDEQFLREYQRYLHSSLKLAVNSIHNNMKVIKTYVLKAFRKKLIENNPFKYVKLKKVNKNPEFLTQDERAKLIKLYNSSQLPDTHRNVLRWFLFVCFTGLRIGDLRSVTHEQVAYDSLRFYPQKSKNINHQFVEMPLSKTALQLIKDEDADRVKGLLFDCISEGRMNKMLKEIIAIIKLDKKITFHTGRHTFATIFLQKYNKANGILILQKLLGHSKLESTLIYTHVLNDDMKDAIKQFDE